MATKQRLQCALLALAALGACAGPLRDPTPESTPLVWPGEPDPPRIAFVRAIETPDDLGIAKGFFQRLRDLVLGADDNRLVRPMAVLEAGGILFVADPGAHGVHRFDTRAGDYELIRGPGGAVLPSPVGLARGPAGAVYVTDSRLGQVLAIRPGAREAAALELDTPLAQPTGIAYDAASGNLWVVDTAAHCIKVFDARGRLLRSLGEHGQGDGQFNYPTLLWRTGEGRLYVTDSLNFRIQIIDEHGRFLGKFGHAGDGSGDAARQKGVAADRYGHVYVVDSLFSALQIFDGSGRFLLAIGARGRDRGEFWLPTGIFIGDDDQIYVADSYNRRVQVFRYIGGPL